jgi:hypothetical protein
MGYQHYPLVGSALFGKYVYQLKNDETFFV